jgi:CRISPR type IV-associated protein Csf2
MTLHQDRISLSISGTIYAEQPISIVTEGGAPAITSVIHGDERHETLFVPPTSIRGRLRRFVIGETADALTEHNGGVPIWTVEDYQYAAVGGILAKREGEPPVLDLDRLADFEAQNPIAAVFGGSAELFLGGKLRVGGGRPIMPAMITPAIMKMVRRADHRSANAHRIMSRFMPQEQIARLDEISDADNRISRANGRIKQIKSAIQKKRRELTAAGAIERATRDEDVPELQPMLAEIEQIRSEQQTAIKVVNADGKSQPNASQVIQVEMIPVGASFNVTIRLLDARPLELGMLLAGLSAWSAEDSTIGGHVGRGCGEIRMDLGLEYRRGSHRDWVAGGKAQFGHFRPLHLTHLAAPIADCMEAWQQAAAKGLPGLTFGAPKNIFRVSGKQLEAQDA